MSAAHTSATSEDGSQYLPLAVHACEPRSGRLDQGWHHVGSSRRVWHQSSMHRWQHSLANLQAAAGMSGLACTPRTGRAGSSRACKAWRSTAGPGHRSNLAGENRSGEWGVDFHRKKDAIHLLQCCCALVRKVCTASQPPHCQAIIRVGLKTAQLPMSSLPARAATHPRRCARRPCTWPGKGRHSRHPACCGCRGP